MTKETQQPRKSYKKYQLSEIITGPFPLIPPSPAPEEPEEKWREKVKQKEWKEKTPLSTFLAYSRTTSETCVEQEALSWMKN